MLEEYIKRLVHDLAPADIPYGEEVADFIAGEIDRFGLPAVPNRVVGQMMIVLKAARDVQTPKRDNLTDEAGYADATDVATREDQAA